MGATQSAIGARRWRARATGRLSLRRRTQPTSLGARRHTNNTAELTALAELLRALLSSSPQRAGSRGVVRTDSEYAAACMMGRVTPKTNRQLAERLRSLWQRLRAKHTVTWRHVEGHSGNKWNDYVDELAARGRQGDRGSNCRVGGRHHPDGHSRRGKQRGWGRQQYQWTRNNGRRQGI